MSADATSRGCAEAFSPDTYINVIIFCFHGSTIKTMYLQSRYSITVNIRERLNHVKDKLWCLLTLIDNSRI